MEIKLANIEREKKEDNLRQLAQKARDARAGIKAPANEGVSTEGPLHCCSVFVLIPVLVLSIQKSQGKSRKETNWGTTDTRRERGKDDWLKLILINGLKWIGIETEMWLRRLLWVCHQVLVHRKHSLIRGCSTNPRYVKHILLGNLHSLSSVVSQSSSHVCSAH